MSRKPYGVPSIAEHRTNLASLPKPKPRRCTEHDLNVPCNGCAGDHRAGDHVDEHHTTCPRCTTPTEKENDRW